MLATKPPTPSTKPAKDNQRHTDNDLGDEGAGALAEALTVNTTLATAILACGCQHFHWCACRNTKSSGCTGCEIETKGVQALGRALVGNTTLTKLDLGCVRSSTHTTQRKQHARLDNAQITTWTVTGRRACATPLRPTQRSHRLALSRTRGYETLPVFGLDW